MKIETIVLKDMDIVEVEGEFKQSFKNERRVPCFLTNYSLKKGKDLGLIQGSLIADLFKLQGLESVKKGGAIGAEALSSLDELNMQKVIYVGVIGATKQSDMTFEKFLEQYHYTFEQTVEVYINLVKNAISKDPNLFAQGLQQSTKQSGKKK